MGDSRSSESKHDVPDVDNDMPSTKKFNQSKRFWAILITLAVIGLLSALENTVVTTALPYIVHQLDLGANYIWVTNVFFLTGCVQFLCDRATVPGDPSLL